jgi:hypothetical protein
MQTPIPPLAADVLAFFDAFSGCRQFPGAGCREAERGFVESGFDPGSAMMARMRMHVQASD